MLGAAGAFLPELFNIYGGECGPDAVWFTSGAQLLEPTATLKYFGANVPAPLIVAILAEIVLVGGAEKFRASNEFGPGGETLADTLYPGGPLDPFNLAGDPEVFEELKVKEIKNGRLAMVAWLGFIAQAANTGEGPAQNWVDHLADPFGNNFLNRAASGEISF